MSGSDDETIARPDTLADLLDLDGFESLVEIGRGGFGIVYRANEPALNRFVAVKVLAAKFDGVARSRFDREGRAMGALAGHPNIVDVHSVGVSAAGVPYIVMAFHKNGSLASKIADEHPIAWQKVVSHGVKLAAALESAHRAGILHRDVKPENVLLSDYGEPILADFGIAGVNDKSTATQGGVTASILHVAPEILDGLPATPRSDVYSLASTLFALLAGHAAFTPQPDEMLVASYLRIASRPVPDLRPQGVPDALCTVIESAMAKDPAGRPATAVALARRLQAVERSSGLNPTNVALESGNDADESDEPDDISPEERPIDRRRTSATGPPATATRSRRAIATAGVVATLALAFAAVAARSDDERGVGPAQLSNPRGLAIDEDGTLYVADTGNHRVRAITATGEVATVTGTGEPSNSGDGRPATSAAVTDPGPVAIETGGQLLISSGPVLRRIDTDGVIRTVVSDEADLATKAIAALADGSILVARPAQILRVAPDGTVDVFAGTGEAGFGGDGGPALTAQFDGIEQLTVDSGNRVFVVDSGNNRIRRISSDLTITTVAGTGGDRTSPDGRPALETDLPSPGGVAVDADGTIFVSEPALGRVRRIPVGGVVTTVAGDPDGYSGGFGGDGGPANDAQFGLLGNLAVNGDGTLFIIDITNNRVRAVTRQGEVTTVA